MSVYIALRFWYPPPDARFQTSSPLRREKLPMEKQSVSVRELEAASQSRIAVWNIIRVYMAATLGHLY
jgi:hypothetical protein